MSWPIILIAIAGMITQAFFISVEQHKKYILAAILKGAASMAFAVIGALGFMHVKDDIPSFLIVIGLTMGMLGDVTLNLRFIFKNKGQIIFIAGIVVFLIGHMMYLAAIAALAESLMTDIEIGLIIAAGLIIAIVTAFKPKKILCCFGSVYISAVVIMTTIAVHLAVTTPNAHDIVFAVGTVLFTFSDLALIYNRFSGANKLSYRILNLAAYYVGQLLIACSLFFIR